MLYRYLIKAVYLSWNDNGILLVTENKILTRKDILIGIAQNCNPGVCEKVLGTIYSEDVGGCAWADEVPGCGVEGKLEYYLIICSNANSGLPFAPK